MGLVNVAFMLVDGELVQIEDGCSVSVDARMILDVVVSTPVPVVAWRVVSFAVLGRDSVDVMEPLVIMNAVNFSFVAVRSLSNGT